MHRSLQAFALLLAGALSSCSSVGHLFRKGPSLDDLDPAALQLQIDRAEQELASGSPSPAFDRLQALWELEELPASIRANVGDSLERAVPALIAETGSARRLKLLFGDELPSRLRVEFGVASGRRYLEKGYRMAAFRILRKVDAAFPTHHLRGESGALIAEAGFSLAVDDGYGFLGLFFPLRDNAPTVLEYFVLQYPSSPRCAEAYVTLAALYEADRDWPTAIERHQDLLVYHPTSIYAVTSEALIPALRLAGLRRPVYARRELTLARSELERWLVRHPGHELEPEVRDDLADCIARLAESDLSVARFYRRIDKPFGVRMHAQRAVLEAEEAGDAHRADQARAMLAALPPEDAPAEDARLQPRDDPQGALP